MVRLIVTFSDRAPRQYKRTKVFEVVDFGIDGVGNLYLYNKPLDTLPMPRVVEAFYAPSLLHVKVERMED